MQKILLSFGLTLLTATILCHGAEINVRPGLWQVTTSSDLLLLVPHIPADQMQSINDLAKEYGLEMPQIEMGGAVSQACITQEMSAQKTLPVLAQNALGCVSKNASRTGNNYKAEFFCDGPDLKGNVIAEATITDAESFTGKTQFIGAAQGIAVNEKADISGKWINADCGTVKPF